MPIGAIIGAVTGFAGAASASSAADEANKRAEEQVELQYEYDKKGWKYNKKRLKADRQFTIEGIEIAKRNEAAIKDLKDSQALDNYDYSLKIRQMQMKSQTQQFDKAQQLYQTQLGFNGMAANTAMAAEQHKMNDAMAQAAFQNEDLFVQGIQETGTAMARGQAGKSVGRTKQAIGAQLGRNQNIVMKNLLSSQSTMRDNLANLAVQKAGSDIRAFAGLMIPADAPPEVMEPYETPVTEYQMPRELKKFDFGPEPIKGAAAQTSTSAPWLNALGSVSKSLVSAFSNSGPPGFNGYSSGGSSQFNGSMSTFGGPNLGVGGTGNGFGSSFFGL
jgi:hypothetical protein